MPEDVIARRRHWHAVLRGVVLIVPGLALASLHDMLGVFLPLYLLIVGITCARVSVSGVRWLIRALFVVGGVLTFCWLFVSPMAGLWLFAAAFLAGPLWLGMIIARDDQRREVA